MKRSIFIVALILILSGQSRAEMTVVTSIEWLSCKSDVIVAGKITKITVTKGVHSVIYEDCTVQIEEVIKGDIKDGELEFCLRTTSSKPSAKDFMNSKRGVVLFLSKSKDHGSEHRLDNKYVPTSQQFPFSILDISNLPNNKYSKIYSKEMEVLTEPEDILRIARTWADSKISHSLWSEVPFFHPDYLIVPAEEKFRAHYMKLARSEVPYERQKAASELYKFPGEETERVLRELLKDETESFANSSADTISKVKFRVRAAAYESLEMLGKPVPKIQLERKPTEEEQRSFRESHWQRSFTEALPEGWKVLSVEDGDTRQVEGRDTTSVVVVCGMGDSRCGIILIPKEWDEKDFPAGDNLGINGRNSQGARHFFLDGELPKAVKEKLSRYYGLERF